MHAPLEKTTGVVMLPQPAVGVYADAGVLPSTAGAPPLWSAHHVRAPESAGGCKSVSGRA
jgi:hypothetical protein